MLPRLLPIVLLSLAALAGCAEDAAPADWMGEARAAHARADEALEREDRGAAREALEAFFEAEVPGRVAKEDARVVRQDVAFRLSRLALEAGEADAALRWADEGLNEGRGGDVFTANLLVARGRALEAKGEAVEAAAAYHDALRINDALLDALFEEDDAE